jgi:hypothetical protein
MNRVKVPSVAISSAAAKKPAHGVRGEAGPD